MDGNAGDGQDGEKKRKTRTFMDPNEIWRLYNDSVEINGMSLSMLVRSKQNDRQGGVSETTSTWWMKKAMRMYCRRASISFMGIKRINIVADASRHSTFECLVYFTLSKTMWHVTLRPNPSDHRNMSSQARSSAVRKWKNCSPKAAAHGCLPIDFYKRCRINSSWSRSQI